MGEGILGETYLVVGQGVDTKSGEYYKYGFKRTSGMGVST